MFAVVFEDIVFAVIIFFYQIGTAPVVQASVYYNGAMFCNRVCLVCCPNLCTCSTFNKHLQQTQVSAISLRQVGFLVVYSTQTSHILEILLKPLFCEVNWVIDKGRKLRCINVDGF